MQKRRLVPWLLVAAFVTVAATNAPSILKPEVVGFSSERLENLHTLIQSEIDRKALAGAVTILARHGKVVEYRTMGKRILRRTRP